LNRGSYNSVITVLRALANAFAASVIVFQSLVRHEPRTHTRIYTDPTHTDPTTGDGQATYEWERNVSNAVLALRAGRCQYFGLPQDLRQYLLVGNTNSGLEGAGSVHEKAKQLARSMRSKSAGESDELVKYTR
jgi:Zn-dependent peptidase ImmA (M78 family)